MSRPGAALLVSLLAAERRGKPGPAREAAIAAAKAAPPAVAAAHWLDAVYACIQAGEPRRALRLLDELESETQDEAISRRARACRVWAKTLDYNWYPGEIGGEVTADVQKAIGESISIAPGDAETLLVEACVAHGPASLLSIRSLIVSLTQMGNVPAMQQIGASGINGLDTLRTTALETGSLSLATWALIAQADLAMRVGFADVADKQLGDVRAVLHEVGDTVGIANTYLVEGDWCATITSSPESLGLRLDSEFQDSAVRDAARAGAAYDGAATLLENVDAPLATGALALRRAALARHAGDFDAQHRLLEEAGAAFEAAGDEASRRLVIVHGLLAAIARGEVAQTMLRAGTRWDLAPRGPIAEILAWANEHGSRTYCTGLGRLLLRAGERWQTAGEYDRAEACCSLSLPLVSASRAVPAASVLTVLAQLDLQRDLSARALVRLEQALAGFELPSEIGNEPERWMRATDVVMGILSAQSERTGSSGFGRGIPGLERAVARLEELAQVPGLPAEAVTPHLLRDRKHLLQELQKAREGDTLEDVAADTAVPLTDNERRMLAIGAQSLREQLSQGKITAALSHARQLRQQGWQAESDRWYTEAVERIRAAGPGLSYMLVLAAAQRGLDDEARAHFGRVAASDLLPGHMLAPLALRAREPVRAQALFQQLDASEGGSALTWKDVADRAEAALETGDAAGALKLATRAIEVFEERIARLPRDPDRVAACDDISAAFVYLVATRSCMAIADAHKAAGHEAASIEALEQAFCFSDRGRSLPLSSLVEAPADKNRDWQQAATEWAAAFERLLNAYERYAGNGADALSKALSHADEKLATIEAALESSGKRAPQSAHTPVDSGALRANLPAGTCLVEYQLVGPQLAVIALTRDAIKTSYVRLDRGQLEPNVNALVRACAVGAAGDEASELAKLILDPVGDVLRACERVIVVPFGALHSMPFHALPFDGEPLGETHVLSYVPAASLLRSRTVDGPLQGNGSVVIGDPAFSGREGLRRLPGAAIEAQVVRRLRDTQDVLIGPDATERRLRPLLVGREVVHLAAHGRLDDVAPSTSSIVLAGRDELSVSDLIGMRIDAGLAVLSACDTGRGVATLGGDVIGLARGLLAAGVERSIVSLWPVDDIVACVTMAAFYERLIEVPSPARALAMAQRAVRKMSGEQVLQRYRELGGDIDGAATSRRRSAGRVADLLRPSGVALDPIFEDDDEEELDESPVENLNGGLERVWAPFILVGV